MKTFWDRRAVGVLALCLVQAFGACSSLNKDAKNLMEHGDFEDAVATWDQVLDKDPTNEEALRLRKVAQEQLLNDDLVTFKGLLDSHQTVAGFDHLRAYNEKRKKWNLGINPNSGFYLAQQTERLYGQYIDLLVQENQAGHPLKVLYLQKTYRDLLPTEIMPEEKAAREATAKIGSEQCDVLDEPSKTNENLRLYTVAFCKTFGKSLPLSNATTSRLKDQLLKLPTITSKVDGFTDHDQQLISHSLSDVFLASPQFSSQGAHDSAFTFQGAFLQKQTEKTVPMSHSYTVKVPFTAYVTVKNTKSIPYSEGENRCDSTGTHCWTETITKYRDVDDFSTLTETQYRDDPRVYEFNGTELAQKINLNLQVNLKSSVLNLGFPYEDHFEEQLLTHNENLPDIGLAPQIAHLKIKEVFLEEDLPKIAQTVRAQLLQSWIQKHCGALTKPSRWKLADHAIECFRASGAGKEGLVVNWFVAETGLTPENAIAMIGAIGYF